MVQHQSGEVEPVTVANATSFWRGQHWLITGAAGSLGATLTQQLASQGVILVLLDKNKRALEQLADQLEGASCEAPYLFPLDLAGASPEDYLRFVEALTEHLGHLDGVIHCAAHFDGLSPLLQVPALQWWVALQANLSAPLLLSRELVPLLRLGAQRESAAANTAARRSHLVFMLDELERCADAYWGAYGAAQWAWHGLCRQLAAELSNLPIQVQGLVAPPFQSGLRARAFPAEHPGGLPPAALIAERVIKSLQLRCDNPVIMDLAE